MRRNNNIVVTILVFLFFSLILIHYISISFAADSNDSLVVPLNFQITERCDKKDTMNNISAINIELPSSTWSITNMEMNFTNIEYYEQELKIVEDVPTNDDLYLEKHQIEGLGVQIKLNDTTTISAAYLNIRTILNHTLDDIHVQIRGYNSDGNAPDNTIYGTVDLNHTILDGWNYQYFKSPINLPEGNYFLIIEGYIQAAGEYHWYYNDLSPNNPDLYRSENRGSGWVNSTQGSPFLYKLVQEVNKKDVYPESVNMTVEIGGEYHKILNGIQTGSGYLKLSGINFFPNNEIMHIPIHPNRFFFNLSYYLKLRNQFLSQGSVNISIREDNFWKINPDINRVNYNYSVHIDLPSNWYNVHIFKDTVDVTASENIIITENSVSILNDIIDNDANWEITANSPILEFDLNTSRGTEFQLGEELIFSAKAPRLEGNFTFILYNELGAELNRTIIPITSGETVYSYKISSTSSLGNWMLYVYWNSFKDASVKFQEFIIKKAPQSSQPTPDITLPLILAITIGGVSIGGTLTVYQTVKRKKRKREIKLKTLSNKFKDILSLNYLMISDIKSGVNVYEQIFARKTIDPSLISGFLDAIRNFGVELTGSYKKSETLTLDYQDSIILMNEAEDFRLILVMSDKPSEYFTNCITNLAKDIEEKYGILIRKFKGGAVTQFAGINGLIELHLNASFASALKIVFNKKVKLSTVEKSVIQKASEIMKQTNLDYFYTTFLMSDQKFDPEMTKVIFDLIDKKVFQPINLNLEE